MDKEKQLQMIEESRQRLHLMIDQQYDALVRSVESGERITAIRTAPTELSLSTDAAAFKGRKPLSVIFPDGREQAATTWKAVVTAILQDCNADEQMHDALMYLRGRAAGRLRFILSHDPEELDAPLKIDDKLYFEGKFDTEYLLKMMTQRVLKPLRYPYHDITVTLRPVQTEQPVSDEDEEDMDCEEDEAEGFSQQMM